MMPILVTLFGVAVLLTGVFLAFGLPAFLIVTGALITAGGLLVNLENE